MSFKNKLTEEKKKNKKSEESPDEELMKLLSFPPERPELRVTGIYGDVTEEKCSELVYSLLSLEQTAARTVAKQDEEGEIVDVEVREPIEFYISTFGGQASEMFSVYDLMRKIRVNTDIKTYGIGKVMSAGVLLLAAGTPGHRYIGKNCRIMLHGVVAGQQGHILDMENEFAETKTTQKMYIEALASETKMNQKYIKRLINKNKNIYIDAQEAVKLGIADIIF